MSHLSPVKPAEQSSDHPAMIAVSFANKRMHGALESATRRPLVGPAGAIAAVLTCLAGVTAVLELAVRRVAGASASTWLAVPLFFVAFDLALGLVVLGTVLFRLRRERRVERNSADSACTSIGPARSPRTTKWT